MKKIISKLLHFLLDFVLYLIAWSLTLVVEIATLIVVFFKYGFGFTDYFKGEAYSFDVKSASRNRSLWNFLFLNSKAYSFKSDTKKSISWHLGINSYIKGLSWVGWFMYALLYVIDISKWIDWHLFFTQFKIKAGLGHCRAAVIRLDGENLNEIIQSYTIENTNI